MSVRERLLKLGASEGIVDTVIASVFSTSLPYGDEQIRSIQAKYDALGFTSQSRLLEMKLSKFLWTKLYLGDYGWRGRAREWRVKIKDVMEKRKKRFGGYEEVRVGTQNLCLIEAGQVEELIPEGILDTALKYKDHFKEFYIGTVRTVIDPILFGSPKTIDRTGRYWFAVLGIWGDDWYELDLRGLDSKVNNDE